MINMEKKWSRLRKKTMSSSIIVSVSVLFAVSIVGFVLHPTYAATPASLVEAENAQLSDPLATDTSSAATNFNWGAPDWSEEFEGNQVPSYWAVYDSAGHANNGLRRPSQVNVSDGIMTQTGTSDAVSAGMVMTDKFAKYGRWETRVRAFETGPGNNRYHPVLALIPGGDQDYHCGATDIDYAEFTFGEPTYIFIHNLPNVQDYMSVDLDVSQWHTFAVELTPDHISWFIDGKAVMTDTNAAAIPNSIDYALNVQLDAYYPGDLRPAQLQLDWNRYYPLRGNTTAPSAPEPYQGYYDAAC